MKEKANTMNEGVMRFSENVKASERGFGTLETLAPRFVKTAATENKLA